MIAPFVFLILGFILIVIEFYVPGMVMGITGGIFVFISMVLVATASKSLITTILFIVGTLVGLCYLIKFALWRIRHGKPSRSIYLESSQAGYQASAYDVSTIGKTGIVLTDLKPGGYILIEGKQHAAQSQSGYLTKGTEVVVLGGQEESLIVKRKPN